MIRIECRDDNGVRLASFVLQQADGVIAVWLHDRDYPEDVDAHGPVLIPRSEFRRIAEMLT